MPQSNTALLVLQPQPLPAKITTFFPSKLLWRLDFYNTGMMCCIIHGVGCWEGKEAHEDTHHVPHIALKYAKHHQCHKYQVQVQCQVSKTWLFTSLACSHREMGADVGGWKSCPHARTPGDARPGAAAKTNAYGGLPGEAPESKQRFMVSVQGGSLLCHQQVESEAKNMTQKGK